MPSSRTSTIRGGSRGGGPARAASATVRCAGPSLSRPAKIAAPAASSRVSRARAASSGARPVRGVEQEPGRFAAAHLGEHQPGPQPLQPGALQVVERAGLRGGEQVAGPVGRAGVDLVLGGRQDTGDAVRGVGRQFRRPPQERGRRGGSSPPLGPAGGAFQVGGDVLVGLRGGVRAVPRPAVGIAAGVGGLRECPVRRPAVRCGRPAVDGRAYERVVEAHLGAELDEPRSLGRRRGVLRDPLQAGSAPQQTHVSGRLGRGGEQEPPAVVGQ
ncbi:hypothetical protein RB196_28230 [Streptomyces sp. PmtA]